MLRGCNGVTTSSATSKTSECNNSSRADAPDRVVSIGAISQARTRQRINASMIRNKCFVTKAINFFFDVYDSRFEVGDHRVIDWRMRESLIDFVLEDLLSLFEDRNVGLQHEALRLAKII